MRKSLKSSSFFSISKQCWTPCTAAGPSALFAVNMTTNWAYLVGLKMAKKKKSYETVACKPKHSPQIDRESVTSSWRNTVYDHGHMLRCEDETMFWGSNAMCLLYFSFRSWHRRRRSKIGCYTAQFGTAHHCIGWEVLEHWWKTSGEYQLGNFSSVGDLRPFVCMIFPYSHWPMRILWLALSFCHLSLLRISLCKRLLRWSFLEPALSLSLLSLSLSLSLSEKKLY